MKILKLDRTGHTTIDSVDTDLDQAFKALCSKGYAMFLDDVQIKALPDNRPNAEILALAPLVGG